MSKRKISKIEGKDKFFAFLEKELGKPLSAEQKKKALRAQKIDIKTKKQCKVKLHSRVSFIQKNAVLRYCAIAMLAAAVCLTIVLPTTLTHARINVPTETQNQTPKIYIDDGSDDGTILQMRANEETVRRVKGVLYFNTTQTIPLFCTTSVELASEDNTVLSYYILNTIVNLNNGENIYKVNYRIRTYKDYLFFGYDDYFKDLEKSDTPSFYIGETATNYYIKDNTNTAYVYFELGGYEYFIKVESYTNKYAEMTEVNETTIEEVFLAALFSNIV